MFWLCFITLAVGDLNSRYWISHLRKKREFVLPSLRTINRRRPLLLRLAICLFKGKQTFSPLNLVRACGACCQLVVLSILRYQPVTVGILDSSPGGI